MFGLTRKGLFIILIVFLLAPVTINFFIFSGRLPWVFGDEDNWLSFWGNYIGGIISAFVAFFIAYTQTNKQLENENINRKINQLPALVRTKIELEKIIKTLSFGLEQMQLIKKYEHEDINTAQYPAELIDEENWTYLDRILNVNLQTELIKCKSFYKEFSSALTYPYHAKNFKLAELELSGFDPIEDYFESVLLKDEYNTMLERKMSGFHKLEEKNYIKELELLLEKINEEISKTEKLQK